MKINNKRTQLGIILMDQKKRRRKVYSRSRLMFEAMFPGVNHIISFGAYGKFDKFHFMEMYLIRSAISSEDEKTIFLV